MINQKETPKTIKQKLNRIFALNSQVMGTRGLPLDITLKVQESQEIALLIREVLFY
jgi:hypothetical protein